MKLLPVLKRPCANCPFRNDGEGIELRPGRIEGIVKGLLADDRETFSCHKTLDSERKTCAGAVAVLNKLGRMPVVARLALHMGLLDEADLQVCESMVIDPALLDLSGPPEPAFHDGEDDGDHDSY